MSPASHPQAVDYSGLSEKRQILRGNLFGTANITGTLIARSRTTKKLEKFAMKYKATLLAAVLAAVSLHFGGTTANAAPVGALQQTMKVERPELQQVDWRPYRHCHRRHGRKWCHGGARRHGYYGYQPGVQLFVGPRRGHHHHHRHHRRHHRH
jgi:hypothetical protein